YMSPEQAAGRLDQFGPSTDVYSLGATLYHLLTGQSSLNAKSGHANQAKSAPEPNVSLSELLRRVQDGEFPPPRAVEPSIPRALEAICLKAMSRQPEQRYQSAEQLVVDLERWLADEPVTAHVEPLTQRARRWGRKHPGWLAGMATTLLVGMMSAAIVAVTVSLAKRSESLARERAETLYYGSQVQTAYREWKQNRGKEMAIALAGVEHANFESELMSSLLNNSRVVVPAPGHFGSILPITYSAATDTLALAGNYAIYCVKLSDLVASATSRPENIVLKLNTDEPNEGNRVRANARELANLRFSRIYKSHSDEEIEEEVEEEEEVSKLVFSSDGMHLFVATEVTTTTRKRNDTGSDVSILIGTGYILRVFEVATGRVIHRHSGLEVDRNHDWTPTPDGNLFLMTNNGEDAAVIDIATGDPLYDFSTSRVAPFAFSPTGNEIATANSRDSDWEVQIRHARTGEVIQEIPAFSENVDALCFNRTGDELIVACGRYLIRWTKRDNRFHRTSKRPHGLTRCGVVSESLSGSFVLAVPHAYDHQFHFNVLSNSRGGLPVSHVGHQGQIEFAAFTGDSKSIVSCGSDGEVRLSPVDSCPRPISKWSGEEYVDAAFSNEGSLATVTDWQEPTIRWIEGRGRKLRRGYERDIPLFYGGKIAERPSGKNFMPDAMAFLQDGTSGGVCMVFGAGSEKTYFLAVGDGAKYMGDATVAIVDLSSGAIAQQNLETGIVGFPCVDPARRYVAFLDGTTLCVWDCRLRETIIKHAFGSSGTCLSFDRLGQKIAVGGYFWKKLGLFDLNDRAPVSVSLPEQNDRADMVVYSPTEDMIAVTDGNRIRLRDARTFRVVRSFSELAREITSLCFTPDGSVLISGCEDGAVTMWNVKFGVPTLTIREQEDKIRKIELSRDGKQMITVSEKEIVYWDLRDPSHE
ncbi:MAG: hypothetical protein NT069_19755, partial [Planctomycetota bacterium]|nr:hypothetical protein [Planctomycetota bacterium]